PLQQGRDTPRPSLQKSPPTPVCGFTPLRRNDIPTTPTLPHHLRSLVSCFESTTYLRGSISFAPRQDVPHSKPSSTSARFGPTATPSRAKRMSEKMTAPLLFIFIFITVLLRF